MGITCIPSATILKRFWRLFIPRIVFFVFCFSLSPFTNETPSLKGVHIFSTTDGDVRKKRNVATPSESVYASLREGVSIVLSSLFTDIFFFVQPRTQTLESRILSPQFEKKKKKKGVPLFPGFKKKKKKKKKKK